MQNEEFNERCKPEMTIIRNEGEWRDEQKRQGGSDVELVATDFFPSLYPFVVTWVDVGGRERYAYQPVLFEVRDAAALIKAETKMRGSAMTMIFSDE